MYGEGVMVVKINKRFQGCVKEKLHFFDLKWRPNGDLCCWVTKKICFYRKSFSKILIRRKYRENDIQNCNIWMRIHVIDNGIRRKQTENWKEKVKWVVKGCGQKGTRIDQTERWLNEYGNTTIGRSFPDFVYAFILVTLLS